MFTKKTTLFAIGFMFATNIFSQNNSNQYENAGFVHLIESALIENQPIKDSAEAESFNLIVLQSGIRNLYSYNPQSKTDYSSIDSSILLTARVVPEAMRDTNKIVSRFGEVYILPAKFNNTNSYNAFNIVYQNIDSKNCVNIINNSAKIFNKVTIGDTVVKNLSKNIVKLNQNILIKECYLSTKNKVIFTSI